MVTVVDARDASNQSFEWVDLGNATLVSVSYLAIPGLTLTAQGINGAVSTVRMSGMQHGATYQLQAVATLSTGEQLVRTRAIRALNGA